VNLFTPIYYLLSGVLYIIALPFLVILSFKKKYRESIPARFFLFKNSPFKQQNALWFHVCSLGEARALKPLLDLLREYKVVITTITHTGQNEAKRYNAEVKYLPYELFLPFWVQPQKILIVLEAEFWYMLFAVAKKRGAKLILLNARISDKSVKKYMKFAWFYKRLLSYVDIIYAQSQADKNRFLALGASNIKVIGNIKLAGKIVKSKSYIKPENSEIIVAGSTHPGEEEAILKAFIAYKKKNPFSQLLVVPRHPERFDSVYELIQRYAKEQKLSTEKFSQTTELRSDIILVDMMGELNNIYAISDIAILGGAFRKDVGGHNPLEPAFFGCKIITGEHFFHQKELFKYVHHVQYVKKEAIGAALEAAKVLPPSRVDETINLDAVIEQIKQYMKE
jgi:3-deoxy-D-manno-octulosonic-acid transferase